jgi:site-specific recombinase XerD
MLNRQVCCHDSDHEHLTHGNVHSLFHNIVMRPFESGTTIRTVQDLLGHCDVSTMMLHTHLMAKLELDVRDPLDR